MWLVKAVHMIPAPAGLARGVGELLGVAHVRASGRRVVDRGALTCGDARGSQRRFCLVGDVFLLDVVVRAHEIGTSRVHVQFDTQRTYTIEIVTDAASLVAKLEASSGAPPDRACDSTPLPQQLEALDETFRRRLRVAFDGSPVSPVASYAVAPATDALVAGAGDHSPDRQGP